MLPIATGQTRRMEVRGTGFQIKIMGLLEREEFARGFSALPESESSVKAVVEHIASKIVSIDGYTEPVADTLSKLYGDTILMEIMGAVIKASTLDEDTAKNSDCSLDGNSNSPTSLAKTPSAQESTATKSASTGPEQDS